MQTIGGGCRGGGVAGGCHGIDGVEDGGEEVRVGEVRIQRRWWAARVPVPFGPGTDLAPVNVVVEGKRRWRNFPSALRSLRSVGFVGEGFGSGQPGHPCPGPPLILYSAGDGGPPAIMTGRPRSGRDQRGFGPIFGSGLEIISNILPLDLSFSYSCSLSEFGSYHRRSVYRACLVMTVITIRLTATITFSGLK